MKWVKSDESTPDKPNNYFVKVWSERHQYIYNDCNYFDKGWSRISDTKDKIVEWFDESPLSVGENEKEIPVKHSDLLNDKNKQIAEKEKEIIKLRDAYNEIYNQYKELVEMIMRLSEKVIKVENV